MKRSRQILDLEHYLEVLERKPGALRGSKPLAQWRAQGRWPASYDQLWERMNEQAWPPEWNTVHGRGYPYRPRVWLRQAGNVGGASVVLGCTDEAAIRHLLMSDGLQHAAAATVEIGVLAAYERPLPTMAEYNQLLTMEVPA